jgi:hypothetical protein
VPLTSQPFFTFLHSYKLTGSKFGRWPAWWGRRVNSMFSIDSPTSVSRQNSTDFARLSLPVQVFFTKLHTPDVVSAAKRRHGINLTSTVASFMFVFSYCSTGICRLTPTVYAFSRPPLLRKWAGSSLSCGDASKSITN